MTSIVHRVDQIVANKFELDPAKLTRETHLFDDLGADSLDQIELVMDLEEAFDIDVPEADVALFVTVGAIADYVAAKTRRS